MYFRNHKSRKKWQKEFINNVFRHKTQFHNTFSKIILNNIELIDGKNDLFPKSLFRFYKPTANNIIDIKKQRLRMSHPESFNDPFDCRIGYDLDSYEKHVLLTYIKESGCVDIKHSQNGLTTDEYNRLLRTTTSYYYNWYNKVEEYSTFLRKLLETKSKDFNSLIYDVIRKSRHEVNLKIERLRNVNIRVACFSALNRHKGFDDIIQMWSHYTDNHKGFCIEYDISPLREPIGLSLQNTEFYSDQSKYMDERIKVAISGGLFPVIYTSSRVNIPKTKLYELKSDEINGMRHDPDIDAILYKTYLVKSAKWSYEKEWRIILDGEVCNYYDNKIPFPYIKRVFLGCKMTSQNVDTMIEIAEELGAEVIMMVMDNKKFILEEHSTDSYKWDKEWAKRRDPFF
jgi:hypothetical protein